MGDSEETGGHKDGGLELSLASCIFAGAIVCAEESVRSAGYILLFGGLAPIVIFSLANAYKYIRKRQDNYNQ